MAGDTGNGDADRVDIAFANDGNDFAGEDFNELAHGKSAERVGLVDVLGIAHGFSCEAHILEPAGNNVFRNDNANCGSHFALHGEKACIGKKLPVVKRECSPGSLKLVMVIPPGSGAGGRVR